MKIGLDIGSTTIKCVILDDQDKIIHKSYQRHYSQITEKSAELLEDILKQQPGLQRAKLAISGSAGMGLADSCRIPFVQEVFGTRIAANRLIPGADVIIELGGEDAKILFLTGGLEVRMNGSCAGGTGAFMDQMATLLKIPLEEMNALAEKAEQVYTIASRCGVFAKSDIQPLLNQGARREDVAASIFSAVVSQTIAGLAQGRPIKGNVVYLGGPLTFLPMLRKSFDEALHTTGLCPENSLYFVALGAAFSATEEVDLNQAAASLKDYGITEKYKFMDPLFRNQEEYEAFLARHKKTAAEKADPESYRGVGYLGVDAGSTTVKMVVIDRAGRLLLQRYLPNHGNPVSLVRQFLMDTAENYPGIQIGGATVTGYGEDIVRRAFRVDYGIVETVAHYLAAKRFLPEVDFIIDIGGQDIKCFKIHNNTIDNIFLNEACSSGCGSFLQTFANALGYSTEEFARLGLFGRRPVDLGSRCTVFMNSSVKQAQKDGATIENISAGLSISVVKNALYKVIRPSAAEPLGRHIVVQGGTFLNDGVLRAFEQELKTQVVRPEISGLMGAYGAALYAQQQKEGGTEAGRGPAGKKDFSQDAAAESTAGRTGAPELPQSSLMGLEELKDFQHKVQSVNCGLCSNHCHLTINTFSGGGRYISGNRCSRPIPKAKQIKELNLYRYKQELLEEYRKAGDHEGRRGVVGLPLGLNMYELLPFWHAFFESLGIGQKVSPVSDRPLYLLGQGAIPSDTVCYPAKLMHGHVQWLIDQGVKKIFYPCMTYNLDEHMGDNHYNCPVVAYYPEVIAANLPEPEKVDFIYDYLGLHNQKDLPKKILAVLKPHFPDLTLGEVRRAAELAYGEYEAYFTRIRSRAEEILSEARAQGRQIIVLAGRPYHVDGEINHGIDKLISGFGVAIITEDSLSHLESPFKSKVLNQWTYHSRLYAAARYIATQKDMNLIQLVSFGCGVDAITTDEVRDILEAEGKIYTQIKIDEIANLGAVRIRIRSLLAATGGE